MLKLGSVLLAFLALTSSVSAEVLLQYFNTPWSEITAKIPEVAEAGYTSLWLPPPTKASSPASVGYDLWDAFDLGSKDQCGSIKTNYGTEAELLCLVETAHRFGLRVYFDNIMNHRAFEVPNLERPNLYPGLVAKDFHLQVKADGSLARWDNTRAWGDVWQVQNLGLAGLLDLAQEPGATNSNFGAHEGDAAPKPKFLRDPEHPEYYCYTPDGKYVGFGKGNGLSQFMLREHANYYSEYVQDYLCRSARWLIDNIKADGLRLDAVKHVPAGFFGNMETATKDESNEGYTGQIQQQFNFSRGFTDRNHRDSLFNTEQPRDDAMLFGEHLGVAPDYESYINAGMRLLDNPLREQLNARLGNSTRDLFGYDQAGAGGFSSSTGVMHAQSHDNDFANHRELQHAIYLLRAGMGLIYTDGNHHAGNLGQSGGAFPRHANTAFLGQNKDLRIPNLLSIHECFARGDQIGRWSDNDMIIWERLDKREDPSMSDASAVTLLVMLNDNVKEGQARPFAASFANSDYLYNYSSYGGGFYKFGHELATTIVPPLGYFAFSWKNPDPSNLWQQAGGDVIQITQHNQPVEYVEVIRRDGADGDPAFSGEALPVTSRPKWLRESSSDDYQYTALIPRVTDPSAIRFIARTDGSTETLDMKLDGGIDLNGLAHPGGDMRDQPPGQATDVFLGYEHAAFVSRIHPELFAAMDRACNVTGSEGAATFSTAGEVTPAREKVRWIDGNTAAFLYHDPNALVGNKEPQRAQFDTMRRMVWAKANNVGNGYKMYLYYVPDGSQAPEGAAGQALGKTKAVEMNYSHGDDQGSSDWWCNREGKLPADFTASSKYKIGIYKNFAPSWQPLSPGAVARKVQMMTTFQSNELNLAKLPFFPHNDYGNQLQGLPEGFHILRAHAYLDRNGRASIYNTFAMTFYLDAQTPQGQIMYPSSNDRVITGNEYEAVVRSDTSVTEVWVSLSGEPSNDGWELATEVTPKMSIAPGKAAFSKEWRYLFKSLPSVGIANVLVRLRELSSAPRAAFEKTDAAGHYTTLYRAVRFGANVSLDEDGISKSSNSQ